MQQFMYRYFHPIIQPIKLSTCYGAGKFLRLALVFLKPLRLKLLHLKLLHLKRVLQPVAVALVGALLGALTSTVSIAVSATTFAIPPDGSSVVGRIRVITPGAHNTLLDIARHFDLGYHEITWANPDVDPWVPGAATPVVIPTQFILPPKPWLGIVVNIPQRRLYYFPPATDSAPQVMTLPVSIAREGWSTPLGNTTVIAKYKDPAWFVPKSIREEKIREGEIDFPTYFPPGPDNPMGMLAVRIGFDGIFIHGTNRPWGVGMRTSHGCLHLYPEDALTLFPLMKPGIPVRVINTPFMAGTDAGQLLITSYESVPEYPTSNDDFTQAVLALEPYLLPGIEVIGEPYEVDWDRLQTLLGRNVVIPTPVNLGSPPPEQLLTGIAVEPYIRTPYGEDANNASPPAARQTQPASNGAIHQ